MLQVNTEGIKVESHSVDVDIPWIALVTAGAVVGRVIQFFGRTSRRDRRSEIREERQRWRQEYESILDEIRTQRSIARDC
jgi:hypothetical protein